MAVTTRRQAGIRSWVVPSIVTVLGALIVTGRGVTVAMGMVGLATLAGVIHFYGRWPTYVVLATWVLTVFEPAASVLVPQGLAGTVKTLDEPAIMALLVATLLRGRPMPRSIRRYVLVPIGAYLLVGVLSGVLNAVPIEPTVLGGWQALKAWTLLYITCRLPWERADREAMVRVFTVVTVIVMALGTINLIAPGAFNSLLPVQAVGAEVRFGRTGLQSVFTHPDHFGSFATMFSVFFLVRFLHTGEKRHLAIALWCIGLGVMSLRFKVILGFAAALTALALINPARFFRRVGVGVLIGLVVIALGGGIVTDLTTTQLDRYLFNSGQTIRGALYETSSEIAHDNFPFGEGLGRFGTGAATQFDSPVYDEYGLSGRPGLSQDNPGVRHDTTWPTILGETGYFGIAVYLGGLAAIFIRLLRLRWRKPDGPDAWMPVAAMAILIDVLFESLGRPSFFTAVTTMSIALVVGVALVMGAAEEDDEASEDTGVDRTADAAG